MMVVQRVFMGCLRGLVYLHNNKNNPRSLLLSQRLLRRGFARALCCLSKGAVLLAEEGIARAVWSRP